MVYIERSIESELKTLMLQYPVVTVLGPRQSGKSILVQAIYPKKKYINLEAPDEKAIIENDPRAFLASIPDEGGIIDEVQRLPELLSYIQIYVDEKQRNRH